MILVDTSIWIDYLRAGDNRLTELLNSSQVFIHSFVLGELACGNLSKRQEILALLQDLPRTSAAGDEEVLYLIERHKLMGRGIGYVDAHLLAAAKLNPPLRLWTGDKPLHAAAVEMGLAYETV